MKYVQLVKSGTEDNPIEVLQQNGDVKSKEIILVSSGSSVAFITGMIKNWSWNYDLKINFFLSGRENGTFTLKPLQKIKMENKPCDRIILTIENKDTITFSLIQYYLEQTEAEGEIEPVEMLYRMKVDIEDGDINEVNGIAEEFISTFQLNVSTPPETILAACLSNQDLLIKDVFARVIGVPTEIKDADGNIIKNPSPEDYRNAINVKHNIKEDIPENSVLGMTFVFRYPDNDQLVRNEFTSYITKDNPRIALETINFKARRETARNMNFDVITAPSGYPAGFVWLLILTVRFQRTQTPPQTIPAP